MLRLGMAPVSVVKWLSQATNEYLRLGATFSVNTQT